MIDRLPPRAPGWRGRLYAWLAEIAPFPHVYGSHDCALFGGGAILAMHGVDPAAEWRGRYTTWRGGLRVLRSAGYRDPIDVVSRLARAVPQATAQIGDLAIVDTPDHPAIGVVTGATLHLLRPDGLAILPLVAPGADGIAVPLAREVWRT